MSRWRGALERWKDWPGALRWGALCAAIVLLALAGGVASLPTWVRGEVAERAAARGLSAEVREVRLGLGRVWLLGVTVRDAKLPGSRAELSAVEVRVSLSGVTSVALHGASIQITGAAADVQRRVQELRGHAQRSGTREQSGPARRLSADGVYLSLRDPAGRSLSLWGAAGVMDRAARTTARFDLGRLDTPRFTAELRGVELELDGNRRLTRFEAARASGRVDLVAPATATSVAPPPSTGPPAVLSAAGERGLAELRERARAYLAPQFVGRVVALTWEAVRRTEALRIGPSRATVARQGPSLRLEIAAHPKGNGGTPLELRAHIPLESTGGEIELTGGPVSLAALGVREGDFGLVGVREAQLAAEAKLVFGPDEQGVEVTSRGRIDNARLRRPALAPDELSGISIGWRIAARAELDGSKLRIQQGELSLGEVRAEVKGELEQSLERTRFVVDLGVPLASCAAFFEALPRGAAPLLSGVEFSGTFGFRAHVAYDSQAPRDTLAKIDVTNECRISEVPPEIAPARFRKPWPRVVQGVRGLVQIESGPGTPDWTPYEDISPHMETAILVCEDEGFFRHRGFAYRAIESSIQQNLIEGRFFRGASTVSMQLAKNLYLGREKTLSRKLQEAVFTQLLEQELSKHEIMELYLNVIEFGPGLYGIRQAARYYFNEEPRNLSLGQALYLGSILPKPDAHHFAPDGRVTDKWSNYLRKLMHIALKIRRISAEELEQGLAEQVAFRQPNTNVPSDVLENPENGPGEPVIPELP